MHMHGHNVQTYIAGKQAVPDNSDLGDTSTRGHSTGGRLTNNALCEYGYIIIM